jgi:hypothetical protein
MAKLVQLSKSQLIRRIDSSNSVARKYRDRSAKTVEGLMSTAVGGASAFGVSFASAKFGGVDGVAVGPVPLELAVGLGALGLSLTGMGGDATKYLANAANGSLCAWAANQGRNAGLAG